MVSGTFALELFGRDAGLVGEDAELSPRGRKGPASLLSSPLAVREFIAGEENQLVRVLLPALEKADYTFQPLLLCGPTGSGKTMLAFGLAQRFQQQHPDAKVVTLSAADFARAYAHAVEIGGLSDFRAKFRTATLLVIDDLQHLADKQGAQQELRRLLDTLSSRDARVVFTCRQSPVDMLDFTPDLCSRLAGGLVVPLALPGVDARRELIQRFFAIRQRQVSSECLRSLAEQVSGTAPCIFATLTRLLHSAEVERRPLDTQLVQEVLAEQAAANEITPRAIIATVAKAFAIKASDLKGTSRKQSISIARGVAVHLLRQITKLSYHDIGQQFGGRDHTTILHAYQKTAERLETDAQLRLTLQTIMQQLTGQ